MTFELFITHNGAVQIPVLKDSISWDTERKGSPGKLSFTCVKTAGLDFQEGDGVKLSIDGVAVFMGFVFTKARSKDQHIKVTAYDQLRYFKNKDTIRYENKTASEVLAMIAADFKLQIGAVDDTGFKIESRIEKDKTLFDIVQNALDLTLQSKGKMYVLYDDAGKLALRDIETMRLPLLLCESNAEDFDYQTSIDNETYNKIKLTYDNDETGMRETYVAQSTGSMNQWGVLQYYEAVNSPVNCKAKADALLELYNRKTRSLTVKGVFGDARVRAGTSIIVKLGLGDMNASNYMLVESAKHKLKGGVHTMDLTLVGGDFIA